MYVGCVHPFVVAESCLPSTQLVAVTHLSCCGLTGQGLVPAALRGLMPPQAGGAHGQQSC